MSEADTPNNQPLPEPTASIDDSPAELSDVTEASESPQIVNLLALPGQTIEAVSATIASSSPEADEGETETADASEQKQTKDADWFALAQKMRQRNRRLLDQVTQLKTALKEKQEALHSEVMRSRDRETLLAQQTEELNIVQEQLTRLFHTLESSHQAAQRQQILIETLSEQLQSSQERIAQLERECALTQQRYNEQSHQLLQAANTCRELRTRLHRQQRQTLQFKAALEKSLEMSTPSNSAGKQQPHQKSGITNPSVVPKAQPIKPWSAEPELLEDTSNIDTIWNRPIPLAPLSAVSFSEAEPIDVRRIEETDSLSVADTSDSVETAIASSQESADTEMELEQELLAEMTFLAEASGLSELQSDLADAQAPLTPEPETNLDESEAPVQYLSDAQETPSPEYTTELDIETETLSEEVWGDSTREPAQPNEVVLPQSNWPSPVLYPLRPPKKRKSLAAIDLPSFPPFHPS
jgi:hypothetical protein